MKKLLKVIKLTFESFKMHWFIPSILFRGYPKAKPKGMTNKQLKARTQTEETPLERKPENPSISTMLDEMIKAQQKENEILIKEFGKLIGSTGSVPNYKFILLKPPEEQRRESLRNHIRKNRDWRW